MKKNVFGTSVTVALFITLIILPTSVLAFWPFDGMAGQVKGAETQTGGGFIGVVQNFLRRLGGNTSTGLMNVPNVAPYGATGSGYRYMWGPSGATGSIGQMGDPQARLDQAVKEGKISQAQETEILSQLAAIKAKQQELTQLETNFRNWLKTNNISTAFFGEPMESTGVSTGASGPTPRFYNRIVPPPPQGYPGSNSGNSQGQRPNGY
ncbi:MAG TPA: hypothetical protein VMR81_07450 [Patescibacteria group bacterium]|nr:hypothetical protein [Patescibacteria group bacterium]